MSLSLYDISVPAFQRGLDVLSHLLDQGIAHARAQGQDPERLLAGRLAPDMYTLVGQVQSASDAAKFGAARLAGIAPPSFADTETTLDELRERIAKTQEFLRTVTPQSMDGQEEREIVIRPGGRELRFVARDYIRGFVLPNFYFHLTTAYGILRHLGVPLGKMDYLRGAA
ncbi:MULTISPECIES: DUF1993 domain-containing protein [Lysobacter]|uniref:Uncharacterized protein n=2 Tax=Lysobacter TaxID=68 RepID=A0A0S2DI67_LYSEN|nr:MULTISPECIES: DUF1993 domain-containing protein [Lysobacter]ALN58234.1 hypothetical protein GLE_2886 [Lysobacter enzymogenes]QCW26667.1 DUF1993 domain-containing protein [Lysobacter enzymogenes]QQQ03435.1 DUF1993 domain-containing protein [Lysobacter enzymogenes]UZW63005.1 DUF1993 domain-containing protein [Lysobacter enzymogenes]WMT01846.1 DUF1993 domain-containing protein [Lysobacter yananisis]